LQLYEDAYLAHFEATPEVLWWLLRTAFDVFDNSESNVLSGLDYRIQEAPTTHLQDIAVRRCVMRLGARFAGDHLVEIRARDSEGFALNPGQVPFHRPDLIVEPQPRSWWLADSVEAFWQANKVFQVREGVFGPDRPLIVHLLGFDSDGHVCVGKDAGLSLPQVVFTGDGAFAECARRALASWPLDPSDALPLLATPVQAEDGAIHVLWRLPSVSEARSDLRAVTVQQLASSRLASPLRALLKQARRAEGAALA